MITIDGIDIDTTAPIDALMTEWAIFTAEFEYDSRIIVCHTFNTSIYRGIKNLIQYALDRKTGNLELRQALLQSQYITVDILCSFKDTFNENLGLLLEEKKSIILKEKYKYIKSYKSYYPSGYNIITDINLKKEERECAYRLYDELIKEIDSHALYMPDNLKLIHRGRPGKLVHKFNAKTGLYLETYNSLKEAAMATNTNSSNISACCNDLTGQKTTGGFKWSFSKDVIFSN